MKNAICLIIICLLSQVAIAQSPATTNCLDSLKVPSAFTPNGDEVNDTFALNITCPLADFKLQLYNNWGETVFETTTPDFVWNGTDAEGAPLDAGVYFWMITVDSTTNKATRKGNLTLIR